MRRLISNPKQEINTDDTTNVIYKVTCEDWENASSVKLEENLPHEYMKTNLPQEDMFRLQEGRTFNLGMVYIMDQANTSHSREFVEAWNSPTKSINRYNGRDQVYYRPKCKI